jgi:hypothetical protein
MFACQYCGGAEVVIVPVVWAACASLVYRVVKWWRGAR